MMVTCHSNTLLSSTRPAEKPSTGFLVSSAGRARELRLGFAQVSRLRNRRTLQLLAQERCCQRVRHRSYPTNMFGDF